MVRHHSQSPGCPLKLSDTSEAEQKFSSNDSSRFTDLDDKISSANLTRADLVNAIYSEIGLSKRECGDLLESMIGHMADRLVAGEKVKLAGFGVFSTRQKPERPGRNPKTGEPSMIKARRVLVFNPSPKLNERVSLKNQR